MSDLYDILFTGEIHPKATVELVKSNLGKVFKIPPEKVDALFQANPAVIKKGVDEEAANKYKQIMLKAGAIAVVQKQGAQNQGAQNQNAAAPTAAPAQQAPTAPPKKETLMERMARLEDEQRAKDAARQEAQKEKDNDYDLSICVKGADVLREHERPQIEAVNVDVSQISVDPDQSKPLEAPKPPPPPAPDVSHIGVMEAGADLSDLHDHDIPLPEIDISALDITEQEGYIVEPTEFVEKQIDLSHLDIAEAGADMSEGVKKDAPPPPPDTSNIKLSE